mmetsp:Transcript_5949/g.14248  ORF Transcript_5949/g.14248 Transcript_5949/m.14248 type:complete len:227 (+) Transcript_5949:1738-2418(+)
MNRTLASGHSRFECVFECPWQRLDVLRQEVPLGAGLRQGRCRTLLKCIRAHRRRRYLSGEDDHGDPIHECVLQGCDEVGQSRPRRHHHHTRLARRLAHRRRTVARALLVALEEELDLLVVEAVHQRQHGAPRVAEDVLDALVAQHAVDDLPTRHGHLVEVVHDALQAVGDDDAVVRLPVGQQVTTDVLMDVVVLQWCSLLPPTVGRCRCCTAKAAVGAAASTVLVP